MIRQFYSNVWGGQVEFGEKTEWLRGDVGMEKFSLGLRVGSVYDKGRGECMAC